MKNKLFYVVSFALMYGLFSYVISLIILTNTIGVSNEVYNQIIIRLIILAIGISLSIFLCKDSKNNYEEKKEIDYVQRNFSIIFKFVNIAGLIFTSFLIFKYGTNLFRDYFIIKGSQFKYIGWLRHLEDFSLCYLLLRSRTQRIKFPTWIVFLSHAILLGHRSILLNTFIFYNLLYSNFPIKKIIDNIKKIIFKSKVSFSLIKRYFIIFFISILTILINLIRGEFNLLSFLFNNLAGYFPISYLLQDILSNPPSPEQYVPIIDSIFSIIIYPISALFKLITVNPSTAINFYLNDLSVNNFNLTPFELLGGVTSGILTESLILKPSAMQILYIFICPIFFVLLLREHLKLSNLIFLNIAANSLGFIFAPYNSLRYLVWTLIFSKLAFLFLSKKIKFL